MSTDRLKLRTVVDALVNDDFSSDEEMEAYFIEIGLTKEEAMKSIARRTQYLTDPKMWLDTCKVIPWK